MNVQKTQKILTVLLVMQWAFVKLLAQFPNFVETYYSNGLYLYYSQLMRYLFGWIPFSIGDLFYTFFAVGILYWIYLFIKTKPLNFNNLFYSILSIVSVGYFLFYFNWGLNYFRMPLHTQLGFEKLNYTVTDLEKLTLQLIEKVNSAQLAITSNDSIAVKNPASNETIRKTAVEAYINLYNKGIIKSANQLQSKHSIYSKPLTYMGFAGYLNPFTNEAQINALIPKNSYASTVCHELAHQIGIGFESEANFMGYLAAIKSGNPYLNYSGNLMALRYCLNEVYIANPDLFEELITQLNFGVRIDLQEIQAFWESYQNWSEKYFKWFYNLFLKVNKQPQGILSYNNVVALVYSYHKQLEN